jgi:hypothetical protein
LLGHSLEQVITITFSFYLLKPLLLFNVGLSRAVGVHTVTAAVHPPLALFARLEALSNFSGDHNNLEDYVGNDDDTDPDHVEPANPLLLF